MKNNLRLCKLSCIEITSRAAFFLMTVIALCYPLPAQTFYGSILGTVTDTTKAVIPGAAVTLVNIGTSERRTTETDAAGNYRFMNLVPASYRVDVEMSGFKRYTREPILVEVQSAVRIDATMEVGNINEVLEVTAQTPLLQTESTTLGQVVESKKILDIPLVGRDVNTLVLLVPGVVPQGWGGGTQQIGGGMPGANAQWLDGIPLNTGYSNDASIPLSQDAVQEFRVTTSNTSADFGRFAGGVVNATSRSGTNDFHGSAYDYLRNRALNAGNFFSNRAGLKKPPLTRNQYGATIGGPVMKNKVFFFFNYEGVQQRSANTLVLNVPLEEWKNGDFSNLRDSKGNLIKIYDPMTTCGKFGNPACAQDASGNPIYTRQQFRDNKIPADRLDKTAKAILPFLWAKPNRDGNAYTHTQNYVTNASSGVRTGQYNWRIDYTASKKQRVFGRWTLLRNNPITVDPYGTGLLDTSSHYAMSQQGLLGDTYTFNSSTVADLRLGFVRNTSNRYPSNLGTPVTKWGWPSSLQPLIANPTMPLPVLSDFENNNHFAANDPMAIVFNRSNVYSGIGNVSKILGPHTFKFGGEVRVIQFNFCQVNQTGGNFVFNNLMTSVNPFAPAGTGYSFASFMLGYGSRGFLNNAAFIASQEVYQGYYITDNWQLTPKLTFTGGVRWELPGAFTERFDRYAVFQRDAPSPFAAQVGMPNLKGKLALVNSADRPDRHNYDVPYHLLSPRVGLAYRVADKVVWRAGYGLTYLPIDINFGVSGYVNSVNNVANSWTPSIDGGLTPYATLSNPFPDGLIPAMGHDPSFQSLLLGQAIGTVLAENPYAYNQQWNMNLEFELREGLLLEVAYAGAKGTHLMTFASNQSQLNPALLSLGSKLNDVVPNPFYGMIKYGALAAAKTTRGQLLRPYPQYQDVQVLAQGNRDTRFDSLQAKLEKRFRGGSSLLGAYTWSKLIGNAETAQAWSETNFGSPAYITQNYYDLSAERSVTQGNAPHRLVVSYVLDLPVGRGKKLLGGVSGVVDKLLSGWSLSGITSFQSGFPVALSNIANLSNSFNTSGLAGNPTRPNRVVPGSAAIDACAQCKLSKWFKTENFALAPAYTFGNVGRLISDVRSAGVNNWDIAILKQTKMTETAGLQFRAELFNTFNRVQFGWPGLIVGTASFGQVSSQGNSPRIIQFGLRLSF